jgi:hypothetical protein
MFLVSALLMLPYGTRSFILIPILSTLWILHVSWLQRRLDILRLSIVAMVLFLFVGAYGVYRDASALGQRTGKPIDLSSLVTALGNVGMVGIADQAMGRFDAFDFWVMSMESFPSTSTYLLGRSLVDFVVQPIPRTVYPDKPYKTPAFLTQLLMPGTRITFTPEYGLVTELFVNFWIPGVIFGAACFGVLMRVLEAYVNRHDQNPSLELLYAHNVMLPWGWMISGFNSDATVGLLMNLVFTIILLLFITMSPKHKRGIVAARSI